MLAPQLQPNYRSSNRLQPQQLTPPTPPLPCPPQLIAWKKGQVSRIHNHGQSHCWLTVLGGGVEELRFTSGDTPVAAEPALAPRLPGVIEATT